MKNIYFIVLVILIALLGLGALGGGGAMILDPSGDMIQMPNSMLEHTPFSDFLIPGIILALVFGVIPLLLIRPLIKKSYSRILEGLNVLTDMHWSWTFVIYLSLGLVIWIQVQMQMIQEIFWLHDLYTYYAIFMVAMALMPGVRKRFKKATKDINEE